MHVTMTERESGEMELSDEKECVCVHMCIPVCVEVPMHVCVVQGVCSKVC